MPTPLDDFFDHYYRCRPVNATFTGIHEHDHRLPDWSPRGLDAMDAEMQALRTSLRSVYPEPASLRELISSPERLDAALAQDFLEIQLSENAGLHGARGNPTLWTGEALFGIVALMIRDFAPLDARLSGAASRLAAIPAFLEQARATIGRRAIPSAWVARALRECDGAAVLLSRGVESWLAAGAPVGPAAAVAQRAVPAAAAFAQFADWIRTLPVAPEGAMACGADDFDRLLARGHRCDRSRADLLADARRQFTEERRRLDELARASAGSWAAAQTRIGDDHPAAADYLPTFHRVWAAARQAASDHDLVTWPDWPIRYVTYPAATREAAPYLYYLHYRSPAPFDAYVAHDYVVPALPEGREEQHLRTWNHAVIKLNHIVHHGGLGHHVQNWHAYHRAPTCIGRIAAVDCATRLGMFCGGTLAEGWACYATRLMEECGFLGPLDRLYEQHSRVRALARAIVDIGLHQGTMTLGEAAAFYVTEAGMSPEGARGEAVKNSMFPGAAIMYWIGTQGILDLREALRRRRGAAWSLRAFHDELLGFGAIPVPLIARLLT